MKLHIGIFMEIQVPHWKIDPKRFKKMLHWLIKMNRKKVTFMYFFFISFILCFCLQIKYYPSCKTNSEANLSSKITNIKWYCTEESLYEGEDGNHTTIEFYITAKITNSHTEDIFCPYLVYFQYNESNFPEHSVYSGALWTYNYLFYPGVNSREWLIEITIKNTVLQTPPSGEYTFWLSDVNQTEIKSVSKTLKFSDSILINFLRYDYVFLIIGIASTSIVGVLAWYITKIIHRYRLNEIVTKKLKVIKNLVDQAIFDEVKEQLEALLSDIDTLNNVELRKQWNLLEKRWSKNMEIQDRLDCILKNSERIDETESQLLKLLKEIHHPEFCKYIDPLIESKIILSLKNLNEA